MNLLYVIHYPVFGGPHNQALRLDAALNERGISTTIVVPDEPGNARTRLSDSGLDVVTMPLHRVRAQLDPRLHLGMAVTFLPEVQRLRALIRRRRIDVVMIGGLVNPHAAIAARLEGVPVVWQILDSRAPGPLRRAMMPFVNQLAGALMFTGEALIPLHLNGHPPRRPVFIYYPPVDTTLFVPSALRRREARRRFGIPEDALVVGSVANLNPQKGIEYFIRASGEIARARPDVYFLVVGSRHETHPEYSRLIDREASLSRIPPDRLIFAGGRTDIEHCLPAMDVKLLTSVPRSEGTPTTVMEAMACGLPVVATDVGALRDVVKDGETGVLVPPLDPPAIARATLRLLEDARLRGRLGDAGRQRAENRFSVHNCADVHVAAFRAALGIIREPRIAPPATHVSQPTAAPVAQAAHDNLRAHPARR